MLAVDVVVRRREFNVEAAFSVGSGERFGLFGPSGSGKTTVLETVAGFTKAERAAIAVDGKDLTRVELGRPEQVVPVSKRRVGLLRQDPALFPHLNVEENVAYSLRATPQRSDYLIERLGLQGLEKEYPRNLSGGQAQRVAIARMLAAGNRILLFDEPFRGLDDRLRSDLIETLIDLAPAVESVSMVLVAHELTELQRFAHRIGVIDRGQVLQVGSPSDIVASPSSLAVARLVGYVTLLAMMSEARSFIVGVHPDRVRVGAYPNSGLVVRGRMVRQVPFGTYYEADFDLGSARLRIRLRTQAPQTGDEVSITLIDPLYFDENGSAVSARNTSGAGVWEEGRVRWENEPG
ncbi:MAG: ABC transporter ATP-binding protein [Ferrimicrobium sp.]